MPPSEIKYYLNEQTNQILVSGSSTVGGMNALLTSSKNPNPIVNPNTTAKIVSLGTSISYVVNNGVDSTIIPIDNDQELWVYRGYQSVGVGDAGAYRYNPHLHRPYKAYMLTQTGSGIPAVPWLPIGNTVNSRTNSTTGTDINNFFGEKQLAVLGNSSPNITTQAVSGSFQVYGQNRQVRPWIFSKYTQFSSPPTLGAYFDIYTGSLLKGRIQQSQNFIQNTSADVFDGIVLNNGNYTFTSSAFPAIGNDGTPAVGSTQFGLCTQFGDYVSYSTTLTTGAIYPVRIDFIGTNSLPQFFTLPVGKKTKYKALVGSPSASSADLSPTTFQNNIASTNIEGTPPQSIFATRINDVYISFSSSISSSLDGLYIFNQLPQNDVQVTASMFLKSWTGDAILGNSYSIGQYDDSIYGGGTIGGGPTWPTASIRIYTGSFPDSVPSTLDDFMAESVFRSSTIHVDGLAITMSYLIPSESISLKDCLSLSLAVSSGSANSASVQSSLIVSEYSLKFFTPTLEQEGDGKVPTFIENAFDNTSGFSNAFDCQPLINNTDLIRENPFIQQIDYSTNIITPINFDAIINGSALKSTVPESNYTQNAWSIPRYSGSRTQANDVNSIEGLEGGFGALPVIDYKTAYFAYCDQVLDPYPVLNNATQWNIKYLINEGGDALNPRLSPYTAFDVEQSWEVGGIARGAINQISGSSQYDSLNKNNIVGDIAKEPIGVLWSQTSAITNSSFIPLAGNPTRVTEYSASFLNYGMNANGTAYVGAFDNNKAPIYSNLLAGITQSGDYSVTTSSRYGISGSSPTSYASSSIVTASSLPYANPGEFYFNKDQFAINNELGLSGRQLSDTWTLNGSFKFPSTPPRTFRTSTGGWNDSSDYNEGIVGSIFIALEYNDSLANINTGWIPMNLNIVTPPIMQIVYGENSKVNINMITMFGTNNCGLRNSGKSFEAYLNCTAVRDAANQLGRSAYDAQYVLFNINLRNANTEILRAERRYRWTSRLHYTSEPVEEPRNYFNPLNTPEGRPIQPPVRGPFVDASVLGTRPIDNSVDNAINSPYWLFPSSTTTNQIFLSSSNGNAAYGIENGYFQGYIPYTSSANNRFPGGLEPEDTTIPSYNILLNVLVDDEIRFENNEFLTFKIIEVLPPSETPNGKLLLTLDRDIPPSVNKDFFLIRRYRYSPNTIITNTLFPYGSLPIKKEFVPTNTTTTIFTGSSSFPTTNATQSISTLTNPSGSLVTRYSPLTKKENTPSGFLFPEFPTEGIELRPDQILFDLRDKKLID